MLNIRVHLDNGDSMTTRFNGSFEEAKSYYLNHKFNIAYGEREELHECVRIEDLDAGKQYRRIMVTRCGYATVPANSDEEAIAAAQTLSEHDFDWEPVNSDLLADAEVIEVVGPNGESLN